MRKHGFLSALMVLALAACGGSEDAFQGGGNGGGPAPEVESVTLVSNSATIPSEGLVPAEITAYVRDSNNQFMANVPVIFSANSGGLLVTQAVTDANGVAKATLSSAGDPTSRPITVTARAGSETADINVNVAGSSLTLQGPASLTLNQQETYRVALVDSANRPIVGRTISVASARSNTLSSSTVTTDSTGAATFMLTAANSGNDTVTITGLGLTATQAIAVSSDSFTFTTPAAGTEVGLSPATQSVSVRWLVNGAPMAAGTPVSFSTTRGTVGAASVPTDGNGVATTTVTASTAGGAVVTAIGGSSSASVALEFVAATPAVVDLQPSLFAVGPTQSSTLTATVRDAAGNLVKNKTVVFGLTDVTGGTLSVGAATTNSQGKAQTVYTAGTVTSASGGVVITATVQGTAIASQIGLTVSRREVFISLGSGNEIAEPNTAQYGVEYIVQVTDANGNGVAGVPMSLRILSQRYYKGVRVAGLTTWGTTHSTPNGCVDEDADRDGILDPGEDFNNSLRIEAGNVASVSPANGTTDANGFLLATVYYPQEYAYYLTVALSASASVSGTEYVRTNTFMLGGSADDFGNLLVGPPGPVSPFGESNTCANTN